MESKVKRKVAAALLICLFLASATAATDYLARYSSELSEPAVTAAGSAKEPPGLILSYEELEIFKLGYAFGYDAAKGSNSVAERSIPEDPAFIANTATNKFHLPDCYMVNSILIENRKGLYCTYQEAIKQGYSPCGKCLKDEPD